jgi:hypothetical protein
MQTLSGAYFPATSPYIADLTSALRSVLGEEAERAKADVRARYAAFGQEAGTPVARAQADIERGLQQALGQTLANVGLQTIEAERARQMQAAQLAGALPMTAAEQAFQMGAVLRGYSDEEIARMLDEYRRIQASLWQPLSYLGPVLGSIPSGIPQYEPPPIVSLIGGLGRLFFPR